MKEEIRVELRLCKDGLNRLILKVRKPITLDLAVVTTADIGVCIDGKITFEYRFSRALKTDKIKLPRTLPAFIKEVMDNKDWILKLMRGCDTVLIDRDILKEEFVWGSFMEGGSDYVERKLAGENKKSPDKGE